MGSENHERLPGDVEQVADRLREQRPELNPLDLDRIKLRAMSGARGHAPPQQGRFFKSRLIAFLTVGALVLGGGTAVAGFFDWGDGYSGYFDTNDSAAWHQYKPPCKHGYSFGNDRKCHPGPPGNHYWHFRRGWCWLPDGHGGYKWGYGNGWVYE